MRSWLWMVVLGCGVGAKDATTTGANQGAEDNAAQDGTAVADAARKAALNQRLTAAERWVNQWATEIADGSRKVGADVQQEVEGLKPKLKSARDALGRGTESVGQDVETIVTDIEGRIRNLTQKAGQADGTAPAATPSTPATAAPTAAPATPSKAAPAAAPK